MGGHRAAGGQGEPGPTDAEESLAELFWSLGRTMRHSAREALTDWDLAPSQARALGVLAADGPIRLGELAQRLRIAPRSATEVVDHLQERDLVRREPDPADRRATRVGVTESGRTMAEAIGRARAGQAELIFDRLGAVDRRELRRLLQVLRAATDQPAAPDRRPDRPGDRPGESPRPRH